VQKGCGKDTEGCGRKGSSCCVGKIFFWNQAWLESKTLLPAGLLCCVRKGTERSFFLNGAWFVVMCRKGYGRVQKGYGRVRRKGFVVMCQKDLFPESSVAREQNSPSYFLVRCATVSERVRKDHFPEWSLVCRDVSERVRKGAERIWKGAAERFVVLCWKDLFRELSVAQEQNSPSYFLVCRATVLERVQKIFFQNGAWMQIVVMCQKGYGRVRKGFRKGADLFRESSLDREQLSFVVRHAV
jgi:hypothetical protein